MLQKIQAQRKNLISPNQTLYDTWFNFEGSINGKQLTLPQTTENVMKLI